MTRTETLRWNTRISLGVISVLVFAPSIWGEPGKDLLVALESRYLVLARDLDSAVAVVLREAIDPRRDRDWWKAEITDVDSQRRVEEVLEKLRKRITDKSRMRTGEMEVDIVVISLVVPELISRDIAGAKDRVTSVGVLRRADIVRKGFVKGPLRTTGRELTDAIVAVKASSESVPVAFEDDWVMGVKEAAEQLSRVMEKAPIEAKVSIVWRELDGGAATIAEASFIGTARGWK